MLITAFYVTLFLQLCSTMVQWSCQLAQPYFYAIMILVESSPDGSKMNLDLYKVFSIACLCSSIFNYALNWVVIATMQDLSFTICVLSGTMQPSDYWKRRKLSRYTACFTVFAYASCYVIFPTVYH